MIALVLLGLVAFPTTAWAQYPTPRLTTVFPPGGAPGSTLEVTIAGTDLDDVDSLVFTHPGIAAVRKMTEAEEFKPSQPVPNVFQVTIAADVPAGSYEARVVGRYGISNPRRFIIGTAAEQVETGDHRTIETALPISLNEVVNARVEANAEDFYRVPLKAGQQVVFECRAVGSDSRARIALRVFDPAGKEVARQRSLGQRDLPLSFVAETDGDYSVGVRDFVFQGSAEHFYRLRVHDHPLIVAVWPPVAQPGSKGQFRLYGYNLPGGKPDPSFAIEGTPLQMVEAEIQVAEQPVAAGSSFHLPNMFHLDFVEYRLAADGKSSHPVPIYLSDLPLVMEADVADGESQEVTVPSEVVGRLHPARDVDYFEFEATKGQVVWIEVISQQLGLATDPEILVQRKQVAEDGTVSFSDIAYVDDMPERNQQIGQDFDVTTDDPQYRFQAPEDGRYRIRLKDLFSGSDDPRRMYRLRISPESPDFRVAARPMVSRPANGNQVIVSSLTLRRGETRKLDVVLRRLQGFQGRVTIELTGLPEGVSCEPLTLHDGQTTGTLLVRAAEDCAALQTDIGLQARSRVNEQDITRAGRIGTVVWGTGNRTVQLPTFRLTDRLALSVIDVETSLLTVSDRRADDHPNIQRSEGMVYYETSKGGSIPFALDVVRRADFNAAFNMVPVGLPRELNPQAFTFAEGQSEASFTLQANNNNLQPGWYPFYVQGDVKFKYSRNPAAVERATAEQQRLNGLLEEHTRQFNEAMAKLPPLDEQIKAAQAEVQKLEQAGDQAEALAAAREKLAQAQSQRQEAQTQTDGWKAKVDRLQALKTAADQVLDAATKANNPVDLTETFVSSPLLIRIVPSPITLQASSAEVMAGAKVQATVEVGRKYGFADAVEVVVENPNNVKGVGAPTINLAADAGSGMIEISTAADTPPGEHSLTVKARGRFNNVPVETVQSLTLKVLPATDGSQQ